MEPLTALALFAPSLIELGKAAIGKFIGGDFKPATAKDWLDMKRLDLEQFQAINAAGGANPSYKWVEAIVRLQRPFVVAVALGLWAYTHGTGQGGDTSTVDNFAATVGFYLFGDRTLFHIKAKP